MNKVNSAANLTFANRTSVKQIFGRHWIGLIAGAALLGAMPFAAQAATYYGCVDKKEGMLRVVAASTSCKSKEFRMQWNDAGPQGPAGAPGPQGAAGANGPSLVWVDVNGTTVGPAHGDQFAYARINDFNVNLRVVPDGNSPLGNVAALNYRHELFFSEPGCQGTAYIAVGYTGTGTSIPGDERYVTSLTLPNTQPAIYVGRNEVPVLRPVLSTYQFPVPANSSPACIDFAVDPTLGPVTGTAIPTDKLDIDLNTLFPPPLHLRWQ
jgi:hypothetical protein